MTRGPRLITKETRKEMKKILAEVQSGEFAKEWLAENESGLKKHLALRKENTEHPIEVVGAKLREMMSWLFKKK